MKRLILIVLSLFGMKLNAESSNLNVQDEVYMQVHIKLYKGSELYEEFAFNAQDGKFQTKTKLIIAEFETIDDPAQEVEKVVTLLIKVFEDNNTIAMLIPVHKSSEWEYVKLGDTYSVMFYCIAGE